MAENQTLELNLGGPGTAGNPERQKMIERAAALANKGVFVGTSSWKYPGWCGQIYTSARYEHKGKLNERLFKASCLKEYGEVFRTVGVDSSYYAFPSQSMIYQLAREVPADFLFGLKVTGDLTIKRYTEKSRFGQNAGEINPGFLDAELFKQSFLDPLKAFMGSIGIMMFEFSRFHPVDYETGRAFVDDLDRFFSALPKGLPYGVEIRNQNFLQPEYFAMLARHGVTHVFNNWSAMPTVGEQMAMPGSLTNPAFVRSAIPFEAGTEISGRKPWIALARISEVKAPDPEARAAGAKLMAEGTAAPGRRTFIFVNNRLEGNALGTIGAMMDGAGLDSEKLMSLFLEQPAHQSHHSGLSTFFFC